MTDDSKPITPEIVEDENEPGEERQLVQQTMKPDILYLVPITGRPHLPAQVQPLMVSKKKWEETLIKAAEDSRGLLGIAYIKEIKGKNIYKEDFPEVGCVVRMMNMVDIQGNIQFIAQGLERFRIKRFISDKPPFVVEVEYFEKTDENEDKLKAYGIAIINSIKQLLSLNPLYSEEVKQYLGMFSPDQPSLLTDFAAGITTASGDDLQEVLELKSVIERMKKVMLLLQKEIEIAKLQSQIQKDINTQVDENKRRFFLKEQLKAIQKELGLQKDDKTSDVEKFKERFAELDPPEHVVKRFNEEIEKLSVLAGVKLHKKRNLISQFKRLWPDFKICMLDKNYFARALELCTKMMNRHRPSLATLDQEFCAIKKAFDNFDELELQGLVLLVENRVAAFCIFSLSGPMVYDIQFEKSDPDFKGAAQVINQETARYLCGRCRFLNREQDLGIKGLRQAKMSYEPFRLITPYNLMFIA
jgi:hypothetical protein